MRARVRGVIATTMNKACPVILRVAQNNELEILAFKHPMAGNQLVKGTIEDRETLEQACIRELEEESGLIGEVECDLGIWDSGYKDHIWGFCLVRVKAPLKNEWSFFTEDDGGLNFKFFWQPLNAELNSEWHDLFKGAVAFIKKAITSSKTNAHCMRSDAQKAARPF